jgi:hypothetical protein
VMYSMLAAEWPDAKRHLELRLASHEENTRTVGDTPHRPS